MFSILVNEKGGESKRLEFDKLEVTIGRVQGNDIILPKGNVSKRHSRIVLKDGKFIIVDLKSTNGTYVNGRKITSPLVVKNTDKIYIGDFILAIEEAGAAAGVAPAPAAPAEDSVPPQRPRTPSAANVPPPPPRRSVEPELEGDGEDGTGLGANEGSDDGALDSVGVNAPVAAPPVEHDEPIPPPQRRATVPPQPAPIATTRAPTQTPPVAARPPSESRPGSRQDVPAIAPSRPTAPPRAATPPPAAAPPPQAQAPPRPRPTVTPPVGNAPVAPAARRPVTNGPSAPASDSSEAGRRQRILEALRTLSSRVVSNLGHELDTLKGDALRERAEALANDAVSDLATESGLPPGIEPDQLLRDVVSEVVGFGPLDELLADESVSTVTVSRPDRIFVDRFDQGRSLSPRWISSTESAYRILRRIAERVGSVVDLEALRQHGGVFEARLDGGFVLTAALGSLASGSVSMVVRRSRRDTSRLSDLAQQGVLSPGMADFLDLAIKQRRNVIVAGVAGSGRSTVIGALARATDGQRVVLVEESAELDGGDLPWISLSGAGGDARRAISAALRMKPERLVIGDVRGAEALDVVAAFAGGVDGCIVGVTATSSRDALARLSSSARLAADAPTVQVIEAELGMGAHLVVLLGRAGEGIRVLEVAEVSSSADGPVATAVFSLRGDGAAARFAASGHVPAWAEGAPASIFRA